jgi:hypothetical protein
MSDWQDATDPVQPVREREKRMAGINAQKKALQESRIRLRRYAAQGSVSTFVVAADFDDMEA